MDWHTLLLSLAPAVSGLSGVWLGAYMTGKREERKEDRQLARESAYLATLVVAYLDRLVDDCLLVSLDDGTHYGVPAGDDGLCHEYTTPDPKFSPLELAVDWKALPVELMFDVLNLPYKIGQAEVSVRAIAEHDGPPEYRDTFLTRQYQYAGIGLDASALARKLRKHAGLPLQKENQRLENAPLTREQMLEQVRERIGKYRADSAFDLRVG